MATTYKDIIITPYRGDVNNNPVIRFSAGSATSNVDMNVRFYATSNGTLSFEGPSGQVFSVTNDIANSIFSVNDISGIPSIDVNANGNIALAHFGGNVSIGTANTLGKLTVDGGTVTNSFPVLRATQTWNNAAATFTAVQVDIANTASSSDSILMDLRVSGNTKYKIAADGYPTSVNPSAMAVVPIARVGGWGSNHTFDVAQNGGTTLQFRYNGTTNYQMGGAGITFIDLCSFVNTPGNAPDVYLVREASDTLAQRRTTNPQTFRIYNTWGNSGTDYERAYMGWSSNNFSIGVEAGGTGVDTRSVTISGPYTRYIELGGGVINFRNSSAQTTLDGSGFYPSSGEQVLGTTGGIRWKQLFVGSPAHITDITTIPMIDAFQTWGNTSNTFTAAKINVIDNGSASDSKLLDLQANNVSKFAIRKDGRILGDGANPYIELSQENGTRMYWGTSGIFIGADISIGGSGYLFLSGTNGIGINSTQTLLFSDAGGILAQRNGTNPQTFRFYRTWANSGTDYERGTLDWVAPGSYWFSSAGGARFSTEKGGTGVSRDLFLQSTGFIWVCPNTTGGGYSWKIGSDTATLSNKVVFDHTFRWASASNKLDGNGLLPASSGINIKVVANTGSTGNVNTMQAIGDGAIRILSAANTSQTITVVHNTSSILLNQGVDFVMDKPGDTIILINDTSLGKWIELSRNKQP